MCFLTGLLQSLQCSEPETISSLTRILYCNNNLNDIRYTEDTDFTGYQPFSGYFKPQIFLHCKNVLKIIMIQDLLIKR